MESTNTFYPVFEPDQVLTSDHLNQLRRHLAVQDRLSRRLLHGIGIVCGLEISNPENDVITISKGVGITSKGFLITLENSKCEYFRPYEDKVYNEVNCEGQITGKYELFIDDNDKQYKLWELLTTEEEADIDDKRIKPLSEATMNMDDMYVLLYLEIEDLDMLACFGDDCDEKGIRRQFKARKLLISKADLLEIISKTDEYGEDFTEADLEDEINAKYKLKPVSIKRLGYDYSIDSKTLSLSEYYSPGTLFQNYESIIKQGTLDVGKAIYGTYEAYSAVLQDLYNENPFKTFDSPNPQNNALYNSVFSALKDNPFSMQYAYDFLNDLVAAYDEFRKTAFQLAAVCCPDCRLFPRHLMLGKALQPENQPTIFRHYFIPSPITNQQNDLYEKVRLYFRRLVKMVEEMNLAVSDFQEIKVTPSVPYNQQLGKRAIPFYYDVNDQSKLFRLWNYNKTAKMQANTILSYHAADKYNSTDLFVTEPAFWEYKHYDFLRIEGHVGKKYETALSNIMGQRERLNLPIKVIGLKISRRFQNTNVDVECHFDDLQNLYRMFVTELRCILIEEREFFRSLDTDLSVGRSQEILDLKKGSGTPTGGQDVLNLLNTNAKEKKAASNLAKDEVTSLSSGLRINTNTGDQNQDEARTKKEFSQNIINEHTIGYLMDNAVLNEGQDVYTAILNIYASGEFGYLVPGIFIYVILYPVQIAQNIENLMNNIPKTLEELDLDLLSKDYNTLIESANGFKKSIQKNLSDPEYQRIGNEEVILYRLDKLIYHCTIRKLIELYKTYLKRVEEVKQMNLFARFAKDHPGMEHMAGVPKGGTFVIVYADKNEKVAEFEEKDVIKDLSRGSGFSAATSGGRTSAKHGEETFLSDGMKAGKAANVANSPGITGSANYLTNPAWVTNAASQASYLNQMGMLRPTEDLWGRVNPNDDLPPDNVVIADFALPYLCCGSCTEIATMVVSQIIFRLDKNVFCRYDKGTYKFFTDPKGGRVTGPGVSSQGADYFFTPTAVDVAGEDFQFTYIVNNQTVVLNIKLYNPKAEFYVEKPEIMDDGSVMYHFFNKSEGADQYFWDFGDGTTSEEFEPDHTYQPNPEQPFVVVTLKAMKGECENLISKEVKIPVIQDTIFKIDGKDTVCNNSPHLIGFIAEPQPTPDNPVTGTNVVFVDGKFYFNPFGVKAGNHTFFYMDKTDDIEVLAAPPSSFTYTVEYGEASALVQFIYEAENIKNINWEFGDGGKSNKQNPRHEYKDIDFPVTFTVFVSVDVENGCSTQFTQDMILDPEQSQTPEINLNLPAIQRFAKNKLSVQVFGETNALPNNMITYYKSVEDDLKDPEKASKYFNGKNNNSIAEKIKSFNQNIFNKIKGLKKSDPDLEAKQSFAYKFFQVNIDNLVDLMSILSNDLKPGAAMIKSLQKIMEQLTAMQELGVNINPGASLFKALAEKRTKISGKPVITQGIIDIESLL